LMKVRAGSKADPVLAYPYVKNWWTSWEDAYTSNQALAKEAHS
jgi:hypothetical protein